MVRQQHTHTLVTAIFTREKQQKVKCERARKKEMKREGDGQRKKEICIKRGRERQINGVKESERVR